MATSDTNAVFNDATYALQRLRNHLPDGEACEEVDTAIEFLNNARRLWVAKHAAQGA